MEKLDKNDIQLPVTKYGEEVYNSLIHQNNYFVSKNKNLE